MRRRASKAGEAAGERHVVGMQQAVMGLVDGFVAQQVARGTRGVEGLVGGVGRSPSESVRAQSGPAAVYFGDQRHQRGIREGAGSSPLQYRKSLQPGAVAPRRDREDLLSGSRR